MSSSETCSEAYKSKKKFNHTQPLFEMINTLTIYQMNINQILCLSL